MDDPLLRFTVGVHPHRMLGGTASSHFSRLESLVQRHPQAVGIGEVGLDFTTDCRCGHQRDRAQCREGTMLAQREFLRMDIQVGEKTGKPLVLHVRDWG